MFASDHQMVTHHTPSALNKQNGQSIISASDSFGVMSNFKFGEEEDFRQYCVISRFLEFLLISLMFIEDRTPAEFLSTNVAVGFEQYFFFFVHKSFHNITS